MKDSKNQISNVAAKELLWKTKMPDHEKPHVHSFPAQHPLSGADLHQRSFECPCTGTSILECRQHSLGYGISGWFASGHILEGPRNVPGKAFSYAFSYAFYLPDGEWVTPHWHCADARVFVVSGTLLLGYGDQLKKDQTEEYTAGTYLLVPYKIPHFEGAKGNTLLIGTGVGPWCTYEYDH